MKHKITCLLFTGLLAMSFHAKADIAPNYLVHEWGTFTSVQGSDGELIAWNPFVESELPDFVLTRSKPFPLSQPQAATVSFSQVSGKNTSHWLQRMETPVIYFHADEDITVDVSVAFPKGVITEWYPAASSFGPVAGLAPLLANTNRSHLDWQQLRVLGKSRNPTRIPPAVAPSHYFAARTEEASPVRVQRVLHPSQAVQEEKFLFYRGAGNFATPLHASINAAGNVVLENRGRDAIGSLFVVQNKDGRSDFIELPRLTPESSTTISRAALARQLGPTTAPDRLAIRLENALTATGLSREEAVAMVNTWRKDWLGDRGLRVLYLLPQSWTDANLPLTLTPAPKQIVRVMVGRAEILEPAVEQLFDLALGQQLRLGKVANLTALRTPLERRFAEPAVSRAVNREINRRGIQPPIGVAADETVKRYQAQIASIHQAGYILKQQLTPAIPATETTANPPEESDTFAAVEVFGCAPVATR